MKLQVTFDRRVDKLETQLVTLELENDSRFKSGVATSYEDLKKEGLLAKFNLDDVPGEYPEFEIYIKRLMKRRGFDPEKIKVKITPSRDYWE